MASAQVPRSVVHKLLLLSARAAAGLCSPCWKVQEVDRLLGSQSEDDEQ